MDQWTLSAIRPHIKVSYSQKKKYNYRKIEVHNLEQLNQWKLAKGWDWLQIVEVNYQILSSKLLSPAQDSRVLELKQESRIIYQQKLIWKESSFM